MARLSLRDTAGIRRKGKTHAVSRKNSAWFMARRGWSAAIVALLVVDGEQGVPRATRQIASYAEESGRSVVIVINKWDLAVVAARVAASPMRPPRKVNPSGAPGERHKPENFDSGRLMFDYENDSRQIEIPELRADRLSLREIRRAAENSIRSSINAGKRAAAASPRRPQQLAQGRSRPAARHHAEGRPVRITTSRRQKIAPAIVPHLHQPEKRRCTSATSASSKNQLSCQV